ncbi:hypothetical protein MKZ38_007398 [Zalerion maritima]|uniref:Uncharacterized protein n=1 Tax=Zalerion maritima TaxID=339359 RepID=A0AAD5RIG5_9PEZI|nr:hypothetical protein MKZ38_007398 [Zalerion maritima]
MAGGDKDYKYIKDISMQAVVDLASCLARQPADGIGVPSEEWLRQQERSLTTVSKELLTPKRKDNWRPRSLITTYDISIAKIKDRAALLCDTHKRLNPILVRRLFLLLAQESTLRCDRVRGYHGGGAHLMKRDPNRLVGAPMRSSTDGGRVPVDHLEVAGFVDRMNALNGLWVHEAMWARYFNAYRGAPRFEKVESCCEACIVAAIGGNAQHLMDLRANMISRAKKSHHHHPPRLFRFVDAWLSQFEEGLSGTLRESSECMADMLMTVRKEAGRKHRGRRRGRNSRKEAGRDYREDGTGSSRSKTPTRTKEGIPLPRQPTRLPVVDDDDDDDQADFNEQDDAQEQRVYNEILASYLNGLDGDLPEGTDLGIHPAFSDTGVVPEPLQPTYGQQPPTTPTAPATRDSRDTRVTQLSLSPQTPAPRPRTLVEAFQSAPHVRNPYHEHPEHSTEQTHSIIWDQQGGRNPYEFEDYSQVASDVPTQVKDYIKQYRPGLGGERSKHKSRRPRRPKHPSSSPSRHPHSPISGRREDDNGVSELDGDGGEDEYSSKVSNPTEVAVLKTPERRLVRDDASAASCCRHDPPADSWEPPAVRRPDVPGRSRFAHLPATAEEEAEQRRILERGASRKRKGGKGTSSMASADLGREGIPLSEEPYPDTQPRRSFQSMDDTEVAGEGVPERTVSAYDSISQVGPSKHRQRSTRAPKGAPTDAPSRHRSSRHREHGSRGGDGKKRCRRHRDESKPSPPSSHRRWLGQ